jgi:hypothetical protein
MLLYLNSSYIFNWIYPPDVAIIIRNSVGLWIREINKRNIYTLIRE